jgi:putative ABC transport system substrate-binding protein
MRRENPRTAAAFSDVQLGSFQVDGADCALRRTREGTVAMIARNILCLMAAVGFFMPPMPADAQPTERVPRVGFLSTSPSSQVPFREELRQLGWIEGQSIRVDWRVGPGTAEAIEEAIAAELVRLNPALIVVGGSNYVAPVRRASATVPIVFCTHGDPVGTGDIASLARPGGNTTGLSNLLGELGSKQLEILTLAMPGVQRIALLWNPAAPTHARAVAVVEAAAWSLGIEPRLVTASAPDAFEAVFAAMNKARAEALLVLASPVYLRHRARLAELALQHRLPTISAFREFASAGLLLSYGADLNEMLRRCAGYVDKILKGARPGELPVEQASKYELIINLKTARALGLTIPPEILARADDVIE